ncbi:MltA domain-containing protein [Candidatus Dependentiae bacterium]|nr:MltA domain-containing protein [Candidatus Dependentiae bacterium]
MKKQLILFLMLYFIFVSCGHKNVVLKPDVKPIWTNQNSLKKIDSVIFSDDLTKQSLISAAENSLKYINKKNSSDVLYFGSDTFSISQLKTTIIDFKTKVEELDLTDTFFNYISQNYHIYKSASDTVLFTGYYEAFLKGSLVQSDTFRYPLYSKPEDMYKIELSKFPIYSKFKDSGLPKQLRCRIDNSGKTVLPYYTRDEIDNGKKLENKNLEIVWCDSLIDIFFLQIQGSGIVQLDNGDSMRVNYSDENGHPYKPIGKYLLEKKVLTKENVSMQSIRSYLESHNEEITDVFNYNPSYVFFRKVEEGPLGNIEVPLTPLRSAAFDSRIFPKGALCFIETYKPVFDENNRIIDWKKCYRFIFNQDTGGAIVGPGRVDLFTGFGKQSEITAGHLKHYGNLYFLIKK